jgi:predicted outer membrane repeat protein
VALAWAILIMLMATASTGRELILFDDFETGDARFWSESEPPIPATVCVPVATAVDPVGPTVLGNGSPGSVSRAQIQAALDAGGHIVFDLGSQPATVVLDQELVITRDVVLDGGGLVTLDGAGTTRVLRVVPPWNPNDGYTATLQRLTITGGQTPPGAPFEDSGGGVLVPGGGAWQAHRLIVVGCRFVDNHAVETAQDSGGGAIYAIGLDRLVLADTVFENNSGSNGGAVYSLGSREVAVSGCTFDGNTATGDDGNPGHGGNGGAFGVDGAARTVTVCGTVLSNNIANAYGAGFFSVMYDDSSLTEFVSCTFQGNINPTSDQFAGGAYIQGGPFSIRDSLFLANEANGVGGLFLGPGATGDLTSCTFTQNIARTSLGGAVTVNTDRAVAMVNCTIVDNHAPGEFAFAAGINVGADHALTLRNTVVADNTGGNVWNPWNIRRTVLDGGGNLQWPPTRPNGQDEPPATATVVWADPMLLPAGDYGGVTATMPPDDGSPAIGAGVSQGAPMTDQRGRHRLPPIEVGAYERP